MIKKLKADNFSVEINFLNNNFSSPTHWPDWNLVVSKHYNTDFFYFGYYEKEELIGICPVHKVNRGIFSDYRSGQFHFIPNGGWLFKKNKALDINKIPFSGIKSITFFSLPSIEEFNVTYKNNKNKGALTLIIDLRLDIEEIWSTCIHTKRRNMIRKAEKNDIKIVVDDKTELDTFYNYYKEANNKYGLSTLSLDFFQDLFKPSNFIKFDIIWAKKENEILLGIVLVYDKDYSYYWLGFSSSNSENFGQGDMLQWEAIKRMKDYGCKYYDLCYIEKEQLPHIYKFKSGFSKREVPIEIIYKRTFFYKLISKLNKLVSK